MVHGITSRRIGRATRMHTVAQRGAGGGARGHAGHSEGAQGVTAAEVVLGLVLEFGLARFLTYSAPAAEEVVQAVAARRAVDVEQLPYSSSASGPAYCVIHQAKYQYNQSR